jgi:hypothetical protein
MVVTNRRRNECLVLVFHIAWIVALILGPEKRQLEKGFGSFLQDIHKKSEATP